MSVDATPVERLISWFTAHGRDLPWRQTRDPYRILVSEIMLQQTQVDRVLPRYEAFLAEFPTLEALASAPTAAVLRSWSGLGYNRRALNLQRTAQAIVNDHGGVWPRDPAALRRLPGIGPYTAGAVACFAFEQDAAFLDTNMRRVLQRWYDGLDPAAAAPEALQWRRAAELLPAGRSWWWNQALMELGALICTARAPDCRRCPLIDDCRAAPQTLLQPLLPRQRRVAERPAEPFVGSRRWYRGRLIALLSSLPDHSCISVDAAYQTLQPAQHGYSADWWQATLDGLLRDGLIRLTDDGISLPG
jgi:A/G-specific adenine glycosylase